MLEFKALSVADWNTLKEHVPTKLGKDLETALKKFHQSSGKLSINEQRDACVNLAKLTKKAKGMIRKAGNISSKKELQRLDISEESLLLQIKRLMRREKAMAELKSAVLALAGGLKCGPDDFKALINIVGGKLLGDVLGSLELVCKTTEDDKNRNKEAQKALKWTHERDKDCIGFIKGMDSDMAAESIHRVLIKDVVKYLAAFCKFQG